MRQFSAGIYMVFALMLIQFPARVFAQEKEEPEFGVFSIKEKEYDCKFDKNAEAVVLLDIGSSFPGNNNELITDRRIRIKILNERGINRGDIKILYYSMNEFEDISDIAGVVTTQNESGNWVTSVLDRKSIFRKKVNERYSVVSFALPAIKKGSIIEYKYTSTKKHYGGLEDWEFQSDIPTLHSAYKLKLVDNTEFAYVVQKKDSLPIIVKKNTSEGSVYFEMNEVAGLHDEPYMDSPNDFIQKVTFQLSAFNSGYGMQKYLTSWDEVSRELLTSPSFGVQLHRNLDGAKSVIQQATLAGNRERQLFFLYNYVQKEIQWTGFYGKYASENGVKGAWNQKKGGSGDLNLILVNLLEEAGFEVKPLLVAERHFKKVNTSYPFIDQFNKVIAYVVLNNKVYLLDATDRITPLGMIPEALLNTTAFLIDRKKGSLVRIQQPGDGYKHVYSIRSVINKDNTVSGDVYVNSYNYGAVERRGLAKTDAEKYINRFVRKAYTNLKVDSLEVEDIDKVDTVLLKQRFKFATQLESSGDYYLFSLMPFSWIEGNPFTAEQRFSDINFGARKVFYVNYILTLDDDFSVESLPGNVRLKLPDGEIEFTRRIAEKDNMLSVNIELVFNQTYYDAEDYSLLVEFYKKLYEMLDEQIVLKKNK